MDIDKFVEWFVPIVLSIIGFRVLYLWILKPELKRRQEAGESGFWRTMFTESGCLPYLIAGGLIFTIPSLLYHLFVNNDFDFTWLVFLGIIVGFLVFKFLKGWIEVIFFDD